MDSPQWIDISAIGLQEGVLQLFKLTGARDYACSVDRFVRQGWKGEACRVLVDDGFVTVHADCYCPINAVWALSRPVTCTTELEEIKRCAQAILSWVEKAARQ